MSSEAIAEVDRESGGQVVRLEEVSRSIAAAVLGRELSRRAGRIEEVSRSMAVAAQASNRIAGLEAEIERLLEGFDDRLAVVNRRLDRVLDRRA